MPGIAIIFNRRKVGNETEWANMISVVFLFGVWKEHFEVETVMG